MDDDFVEGLQQSTSIVEMKAWPMRAWLYSIMAMRQVLYIISIQMRPISLMQFRIEHIHYQNVIHSFEWSVNFAWSLRPYIIFIQFKYNMSEL